MLSRYYSTRILKIHIYLESLRAESCNFQNCIFLPENTRALVSWNSFVTQNPLFSLVVMLITFQLCNFIFYRFTFIDTAELNDELKSDI